MQHIVRFSMLWLLRAALILTLSISLSPLGLAEEFHADQEQKSYGYEHYGHKPAATARVPYSYAASSFAVKTLHPVTSTPLPAAILLIGMRILFHPLIYKFLKRLLLNPLKFTSHFVAFQPE